MRFKLDLTLISLLCLSLVGLVEAAPPPGHPTVDQAYQVMGIEQQLPMAHQGRVLEAIDSNSYTYIRVQIGDLQQRWLAAPRLELQQGKAIGFADGVLMQNFYSKKLKRTFGQIYFVPPIQQLD